MNAWLSPLTLVRFAASEARHAAVLGGYWLRPYDGLADARRWRWQPRHPCQHQHGLPAVLARWGRGDR